MSQSPPPLERPKVARRKQPVAVTTVGQAAAVLVLGICGLLPRIGPFFAVPAIVLGILVLGGRPRAKGMAIVGMVCAGIGLCAYLVILLGGGAKTGRRDDLANWARCMSNFSGIGKAMMIYMKDGENDQWPPDLEMLIRQKQPEEMFRCPSVRSGRRFDYFYLPPDQVQPPDGSLIACDLRGNHGGKIRIFLTAPLSVSHLPEAEFQSLLKDPINAKFAAALRKAEGP